MAHHDFKLMSAQQQEENLNKAEQLFTNVLKKGVDVYNKAVELKQADDIAQGSKAFDLWEQQVGQQYDYDYKQNPNFGDDGYKERLLGTSPDSIEAIQNMNLSDGARQVLNNKINDAKNVISIKYDHDQMVWRNGRISNTVQQAVDISLSDRDNTSIQAINQTLANTWQAKNPNNVNLMGANGGRLENQIYQNGAVATIRNEYSRLKNTTVGDEGEMLPVLSDSDYIKQSKDNILGQISTLKNSYGKDTREREILDMQEGYINSLSDIDYKAIITQGNKDIDTQAKNVIASKQQIVQGLNESITDAIQRNEENGGNGVDVWEKVKDKDGKESTALTDALGIKSSIESSRDSYINLAGNDVYKQVEYAKEFDTIVGDKLIETQLNKILGDVSKGYYSDEQPSGEIIGVENVNNDKETLQGAIDLLPDTIQKQVLQDTYNTIKRNGGDLSNLQKFYVEAMQTLGDGTEIMYGAIERISAGWSKDQLNKWLYDNIEGKGGIISQATKERLYNLTKYADLSGIEKERYNQFMKEATNAFKGGGFGIDTNGDKKKDDLPASLKNEISNLYWNTVLNDDKGEYWGEKGRETLKGKCMDIISKTTIDGFKDIYKGINDEVKKGTLNDANGYKLVEKIRENPLVSNTANEIASALRLSNKFELYKNIEDEKYFLNQASKVYYNQDDFDKLSEWEKINVQCGTAIYRVEALEGRDLEKVAKKLGANWKTTEAVYDKQGRIRFVVNEGEDGVVTMLTPRGAINPEKLIKANQYSSMQDGYIATFGQRDRYGNINWNTTSDDGWINDEGEVLISFTRQGRGALTKEEENLTELITQARKRGDDEEAEKLISQMKQARGLDSLSTFKKSSDIVISTDDIKRINGTVNDEITVRKGIYKTSRGIR